MSTTGGTPSSCAQDDQTGGREPSAVGNGRGCPPLKLRRSRLDRPRPESNSPATDGDAPRHTTSQHKTHNTATCDVHYPWHPWFGHRVLIIEHLNRCDRSVARCRREGDDSGRALELPHWMLDRAACCTLRLADAPVVRATDLRRLRDLLRQASGSHQCGAVQDRYPSSSPGGITDGPTTRSRTPDPTGPVSSSPDDTSLGAAPIGCSAKGCGPDGPIAPPASPVRRRGRSRPGGRQ
jgi:hypothetical protein